MSDLLKRILADAAILAALTGGLLFILKKWIAQAIEYHYTSLVEREKAVLELEKTKAMGFLQTQSAVYPELVELVYRLRNHFRATMEQIRGTKTPYPGRFGEPSIHGFGEELYLLTEHLYKHRAFLDRDIFEMLHETKRALQDANVILNTLTRPPERAELQDLPREERENRRQVMFDERRSRFAKELQHHFDRVDQLYPQIVKAVQKFMQTALTREK